MDRDHLPYQSHSPRFYSRERSLSVKLASICSCFYRSGEISVSTAVHDVRLSRERSFFNPDAGRNSPKGSDDDFPGEMSRLSCVSPHDPFSSTILARTTVPFQPSVPSKASSSPLSSSFTLLCFRRCPKSSIRFPASLALPVHTTPFLTLKLAFSLLSLKAADFPHFTFQSHERCDFLPHFHSDNIEGAPLE